MEYFLIFCFQFMGCFFHVMVKIAVIDKRHPEKKIKEVIAAFWEEDWNTLVVSAGVLALNLLCHFVVDEYFVELTKMKFTPLSFIGVETEVPYTVMGFMVAFMLGYMGQWLIYKFFGTAEKYLQKKTELVETPVTP